MNEQYLRNIIVEIEQITLSEAEKEQKISPNV